MRKPAFVLSILASLVLSLAGCGDDGDASPGTDAGSQLADSGASTDAGGTQDSGPGSTVPTDAGPGDVDGGPAPTDAGSVASVRWITVAEPVTIDRDIALDYAYQYELVVPDGDLSYSLSLERCSQMAGETEQCFDESRPNMPGVGFVRWGIDPSQYAVGVNRYRFHLTLTQGGTRIDEATIELVATVTACTECGPGSGG